MDMNVSHWRRADQGSPKATERYGAGSEFDESSTFGSLQTFTNVHKSQVAERRKSPPALY
jgi:hypothetical protein